MLNFNWLKKFISRGQTVEETIAPEPEFRAPLEYPSLYGAEIWAVGGGKGGVGKSFVASSLGILLSKQGKRVLLIDADLGAANLHTFLGIDGGRNTLSSFLKEEQADINSVIGKTPLPNLDLISGARDSLDVADLKGDRISRLKTALRKVDYDYVILDIGPGTTSNLLDMFLMSNEGIILSTPEPTTIENNYRFLKCLFLRKIKILADSQEDGKLKDMLQKIFSERWTQRVKTVSDIIEQLSRMDSEQGRKLRDYIANMRVSMIMNQVKREEDRDMGPSIKRACSDYFGVDIKFLGSVSYEDSVSDSIRSRKPLLVDYAESSAARSIESCLGHLTSKGGNTNQFTF